MKLANEIIEAFTAHVLADYPREAVGCVVDGLYIPCENKHPQPEDGFVLKAKDQILIEQEHGPIKCILHSHTYSPSDASQYHPEWPSHQDMIDWLKGTTPWGIVATDGKGVSRISWLDDNDRPPLLGRTFAWGINDCFSLVRDYYKEKLGIELKNIPRAWAWEARGEELFVKNFEKFGFKKILKSEAKEGDVILYQIKARTPNHCAVITGPNEIMHHLPQRESELRPRTGYEAAEKLFLRHKDVKDAA